MGAIGWVLLGWVALSFAAVIGYAFGVTVGRRQALESALPARPRERERERIAVPQ